MATTTEKTELVDIIFSKIFGDGWSTFFSGDTGYFGAMIEDVNIFAVTLIFLVTLFTIIAGVFRTSHKREFLGRHRSISFWLIRLCLFIGCCFPTLNGYSIAQALLLKVGVRYSADIGNKIALEAFQQFSDAGQLPTGSVGPVIDSSMAEHIFDSAICQAYLYKHYRGGGKIPAEPTLYGGSQYGNQYVYIERGFFKKAINIFNPYNYTSDNQGIQGYAELVNKNPKDAKLDDINVEKTQDAVEKTTSYEVERYGAKFGGNLNSGWSDNVCGQMVLTCPVSKKYKEVVDNAKINSPITIKSINFTAEEQIRNIAYSACKANGLAIESATMQLYELAKDIIEHKEVPAGKISAIQNQYTVKMEGMLAEMQSVNGDITKLMESLQTIDVNSISGVSLSTGDSMLVTIKKELESKGFMMLGFFYHQISGSLDSLKSIASVTPNYLYPDYASVEPDADEANGFFNMRNIAETYKQRRSGIFQVTDDEKNIPSRKSKDLATTVLPYMNTNLTFANLDANRPIESLMTFGNNLFSTASTMAIIYATFDLFDYESGEAQEGDKKGKGILKRVISKLLYYTGIAMVPIISVLIIAGIFLLYVVPAIPLVTWLFAIFGWIIVVVETILAIPFWAVAASTSSGDGFIADTGRSGMVLFLNVVIRPILLPILFFFAITLSSAFCMIIVAGFETYMIGQTAGFTGPVVATTWLWKVFFATYLFVMAFKLSHEIMAKSYDYIMRFINSTGRSDYEANKAHDAEVRGMAAGAAALGAIGAMNQGVKQHHQQEKQKEKSGRHPTGERKAKD